MCRRVPVSRLPLDTPTPCHSLALCGSLGIYLVCANPTGLPRSAQDDRMDLTDAMLVFLDVETTGLSPATGERIVEIGVVICRGGIVDAG